jgi:thioredoxin 1
MMRKITMVLFAITCAIITVHRSNAGDMETLLQNARSTGKAVMLELGSEGCIPCEQMKPVMQKLSTDYRDRLEVVNVDVRKDRSAAQRFHVFAIPMQIFLDKNSNEIHRHFGYYSYEEIIPVLKKMGIE